MEALSALIDHALTMDEATMQSMAEKAVYNARQFSVDAMCANTLAVYEEVMAEN